MSPAVRRLLLVATGAAAWIAVSRLAARLAEAMDRRLAQPSPILEPHWDPLLSDAEIEAELRALWKSCTDEQDPR